MASVTISSKEYRYRYIRDPIQQNKYHNATESFAYKCTCKFGTAGSGSGKTFYWAGDPADAGVLYCKPTMRDLYMEVPTTECAEYIEVFGNKICLSYKVEKVKVGVEINDATCEKDNATSSWKCDSGNLVIRNNTFMCEVSSLGCANGYTLENNKCYGPWSAWSTTVYTPSSTMEVQTRTK